MAKKHLPDAETLRQLLRYEPETGKLYWRERGPKWFSTELRQRQWNTRHAGKEAFVYKEPAGYLCGQIFNKRQRAHVVAWAIAKGSIPDGVVDHINHDKADNRIANLRVTTQPENCRNQIKRKNNSTGVTGVARVGKRWMASIMVNRRGFSLGHYGTIEEAAAARKDAEQKYGFHKNHGK